MTWRAALGPYRATLRNTSPPAAYAALNELFLAAPIVPTLYLHGRDDGCFTPGFARWVPEVLPPGSKTIVVDRAGHFLHLERPAAVGEQIIEFLGAAT